MDILYPIFIILVIVSLYLYLRAPAQDEARKRAAYERAHEYGPCRTDDRLTKYMSDVEVIKRQESIHDNCEGHALCDLVSSIEYDYRQQKDHHV